MILLNFDREQIKDLKAGIEYAKKVRGFDISDDGIKVNVNKSVGGFCVEAKDGVLNISYDKKNEFYR